MIGFAIWLMEKGLIPDFIVRGGIRSLLGSRLKQLKSQEIADQSCLDSAYAKALKQLPVAIFTEAANQQHYEVPAEFYALVLGPYRKYSCGYWEDLNAPLTLQNLGASEKAAFDIYIERAQIKDGQNILELGCGWGSLSLYLAKKFPGSQVTGVSNSNSQREYIMATAKIQNLSNIQILTRNVAELETFGDQDGSFDRVISIEMFEHLKNYQTLFQRIHKWLKPGALMFVHIFTHQKYNYPFETEGEDNWMGKYFFTGGHMPSQTLLSEFQSDLKLQKTWQWNGRHYEKTSNAWLKMQDDHQAEVLNIFERTYGKDQALVWVNRWRVFFLSCAELFGFQSGAQWGVTHYLFKKED